MNFENDILIVNDENTNLQLLSELLQKEGYQVRSVAQTQTAIDTAVDKPPGLILLDVHMPEKECIEICQRLKQAGQTRSIPIIFVKSLQDVDWFETREVDAVSRPYQEILEQVRTHLRFHELQQQLEQRTAQLEQEIATRKKIEAEFQAQTSLFEGLLNNVSDTIEILDPHTFTYIRWNNACTRITGYTDEEFGAMNPTEDFFDPADLGKVEETIEKAMRGERAMVAANVFTKDGRRVPMEFTAVLANDAAGDPLYFISIGRDITKRLEMENQREELAAVAERERLTRRLHDAVTQTLFSASVIAESTPRITEKNPELAKQNLEQLAIMLRGALAEMRTMLIELKPAALLGKPFGELIKTLIEANQVRLNCPIHLTVEGALSLPEDVTIVFYRIAQETMNNIVKYADADEVHVHITSDEDGIRLSITDNGHGFELDKIPPGHYGLQIMAERITRIGGRLTINSKPEQGTQIVASWSENTEITHE